MENYSRLTENEIKIILNQFGIRSISSFELLSGGSENTNYLVKSEQKKYVLCIFEQKTDKNARELAQLLKYLEQNQFTTTQLIYSANNESVIIWKGKPIILKIFIEGEIIKDLTPYLLKLIGKELAKLHQIEAPEYLPKQLNYGIEEFIKVNKYAANSDFAIWLKDIENYISPYLKLNLPKSLIHSDVFWDNVIISEDGNSTTTTIIDFEEAANYYRIFDLGMAIIGTCGEEGIINLEKTKYLLKAYQKELKLSEAEINSLRAFTIYAGASMTYWRHQNFNYIKPKPKMFNHYLGLKVIVDDLTKLPTNCFAELLKSA